jgi:hypothetical protein
MALQFQLRNDTVANWTAADPVLLTGEVGVESDTGKFKIGDGSTAWTSLGYAESGATVEGVDLKSTGEAGGTKFLREDGDGTCSWQTPPSAAWDGDIADIDLDGGTDIGADLADADLILVDDGATGTNRKATFTRVWTWIKSKASATFSAGEVMKWDTDAATTRTNLGLGTGSSPTFAGITITGVTITADSPNSLTQTWNNSGVTFTAQKVNVTDTASNASSLLGDWQVAGSSKFSIRKDGLVSASTGFISTGSSGYTISRDVSASRQDGFIAQAASPATSGSTVKNSPSFVWFSRAWNTTATASSKNNTVECLLVPTSGSTTSATLTFRNITVDGSANTTDLFTITTGGACFVNGTVRTAGYTVATLPTPTTGMRCYVTDATATTFYSTVSGGGANIVPVFYNGTNWVIA